MELRTWPSPVLQDPAPGFLLKGKAKTSLSIAFGSGSMGRATLLSGFFAIRRVSVGANAEQRLTLRLPNKSFDKHQKAVRDIGFTAGQQKF